MGVLIAGVWMFALFSGGVLTLGLIALATGRLPFTMWGEAWTSGEARGLGAVWTVVGATYAVYGLLGGVVLSIEYETRATNPLIGHWWGFFVPMIPGLVLIGGLLLQLQIYNGHRGDCAKAVRAGRFLYVSDTAATVATRAPAGNDPNRAAALLRIPCVTCP